MTRPLTSLVALFTTLAISVPAFAETTGPKPAPRVEAKAEAAKPADVAKPAEAKPVAKRVERRIAKKDGAKTVKLAADGTKAPEPAAIDVGDSKIAARPQNPIVQVELERAPIKFELHELRGPYAN